MRRIRETDVSGTGFDVSVFGAFIISERGAPSVRKRMLYPYSRPGLRMA